MRFFTSSSRSGSGQGSLLVGSGVFLVLAVCWRVIGPEPHPRPAPAYSCILTPEAVAYKHRVRKRLVEEADVVVIGDSRVLADLSPSAFEAASGLRLANIGFPASWGGQLVPLLESLDGSIPKRLLVALSPVALHVPQKPEETSLEGWPLDRFILDACLNSVVQDARSRGMALLSAEGVVRHYGVKYFVPSNGWSPRYPEAGEGADRGTKFPTYLSEFRETRVNVLPLLGRRLRELEEKGWKIAALRLPVARAIKAMEDTGPAARRFASLCEELGIPYLDHSGAEYGTYDGSHLDAGTAERYTRDLAAELRGLGW